MDSVHLPRLMISAPHKSAGKTTISLGIVASLVSRGVSIRSFKKGPDYIDPVWHRLASGSDCYNLDSWLMGREGCLASFQSNSGIENKSIALVEGNHGLHDGFSLDGSDSTAGLAQMLQAPVLLVVDSRKTNRGIAALVMGMQVMPPKVDIKGVILNQVSSARQADKQKQAIEHYCKVPVLGALPYDKELYYQLLWQILSVRSCPQHRRLLASHCPHCQKHFSPLRANTYPGFCPMCHGWLGEAGDAQPVGEWDQLAATAVAGLLQERYLVVAGSASRFPENMKQLLHGHFAGNIAELTRFLRVSRSSGKGGLADTPRPASGRGCHLNLIAEFSETPRRGRPSGMLLRCA